MSEPKLKLVSWDEYLAWEAEQPIKHELVGGEVRAMSAKSQSDLRGGGTRGHSRIGNNLRGELRARLRGHPCEEHGPDLKVWTGTGNARYPDALIDCGRTEDDALYAQEPVAVFEVLSRSTAWIDLNEKFDDYDATPAIRHYVLIFQDQVRVMAYGRNEKGRFDRTAAAVLRSLDDALHLPSANASHFADLDLLLPLSALYDGLDLPAG